MPKNNQFMEMLAGLVILIIILLVIGTALKVIVESFGLIIVVIVLWYVYTHVIHHTNRKIR